VDTASYANVRRFLNEGRLPPPDAVRIEELINYFRYEYASPKGETPFGVTTEIANCPWNPDNLLVLVGLAGREIDMREGPARNLVFLIDSSGSMDEPDKMPLLKASMRLLINRLTARDRVGIVVYAGASGVALESIPGDRKARIHSVLASLQPDGSTNGGAGIQAAYRMARDHFIKGGVNRVILATDGDFNVGITNQGDLLRMIERERESGVSLSVLGFGTGNLKDSTMEKLADTGNGNYSYIDTLHEGRKVLVSEAGGTLVTIAKDVKLQVEFNPRAVAEYRLIGYENRLLDAADFNDDRKDAGEIGAGHMVTALYEVVRFGKGGDGGRTVDPLKYQRPRDTSVSNDAELMNLKLRYKDPEGDRSRLVEVPVPNRPGSIGANIGFASAVAQFGMLLRGAPDRGDSSFEHVLTLARRFRGDDPHGYRAEFIRLVELAESLSPEVTETKKHD
jgi:Ca-activated chloride channel family protein